MVLSVPDHRPIPAASVESFQSHRTAIADAQCRFEFAVVFPRKTTRSPSKPTAFCMVLFTRKPFPHCIQSVDDAMDDQLKESTYEADMFAILTADAHNREFSPSMMDAAIATKAGMVSVTTAALEVRCAPGV